MLGMQIMVSGGSEISRAQDQQPKVTQNFYSEIVTEVEDPIEVATVQPTEVPAESLAECPTKSPRMYSIASPTKSPIESTAENQRVYNITSQPVYRAKSQSNYQAKSQDVYQAKSPTESQRVYVIASPIESPIKRQATIRTKRTALQEESTDSSNKQAHGNKHRNTTRVRPRSYDQDNTVCRLRRYVLQENKYKKYNTELESIDLL